MKVLLILVALFISSCIGPDDRPKVELEYSKGDIVYLKPDSTKVLIIDTDPYSCGCSNEQEYRVRGSALTTPTWVNKEEIYGE